MLAQSNTSLASDLLGHTIDAGRLKLVETLGEGAYGVVYRAVEQHTAAGPSSSKKKIPNQYAVKVLLKADGASIEGECQSREIVTHKIASEHPSVLTLHDVLEEGRFIFLVLDFCAGGDMYGAVVERHAYCEDDALVKSVFVQILDAVQSCHDKGIYHRDIKPDNIFVNADDSKVFLGDFGLATDVEISSAFSCGSSFYMSPECIGEETGFTPYSTPASDVWSLGVLLTNMIAGRNPWKKAATTDEHFHRYLSDKSFLRKMLPISSAAADLLDRIFTFNARDRITLPEFREEVLAMKTFFLSPRELAKAKRAVRAAAASYSPVVPRDILPARRITPARRNTPARKINLGRKVTRPRKITPTRKATPLEQAQAQVVVKDTEFGACIFLQDDPCDSVYIYASPDPNAPILGFTSTSSSSSSSAWSTSADDSPLSTTTTLLDDGESLFDVSLFGDDQYEFEEMESDCGSSVASSAPVTPADTLVDPMDVGNLKDLEDGGLNLKGLEEEEEGDLGVVGPGFSIKQAMVSLVRPSLRHMIGLQDW